MNDFVCPACHGPLEHLDEGWQCPVCQLAWPVVEGVPLFRAPSALVLARLSLGLRAAHQEALGQRDVALGLGSRNVLWTGHAEVAALNARMLEQLGAVLADWVQPEHLRLAQHELQGRAPPPLPWESAIRQLIRDYSGAEVCEAEVAAVVSALIAACGELQGARVYVAGAKSGRLADALARAGGLVHAAELSALLGLLRARLAREPLEVGLASMANVKTRADTARRFVLGGGVRPASEVRFTIADPVRAPWSPGAFDVVVSAYFTDVGDPRVLFAEAARLLRPGGRFVHFGPLGYGALEPAKQLDAESLAGVLGQAGFEVTTRPPVRCTYLDMPGSLAHVVFDNLVLVGTRAGQAAA